MDMNPEFYSLHTILEDFGRRHPELLFWKRFINELEDENNA